jgi:LmbE family N-acetylglucosaminyl deacetylase
MSELVKQISNVFAEFKPNEVLVPHPSDVHSDHKITYQAAVSASKWFRSSSIRTLLAYETLSETGMDPITTGNFAPNYFVDIETELDAKIEAARIYSSELAEFPFPRSVEAIEAQARIRGVMAGFKAAEAFQLLKHVD